MIFDRTTLDAIVAGRVDLAFRRWERPRVRSGTHLRTAVGVVEVGDVATVEPAALTDADARRAGYGGADALRAWLARRDDGDVYRIAVAYAGADPRVALREAADLSAGDRTELGARLARMDAATDTPWTHAALQVIRDHPGVVSTDLAATLAMERMTFKRRVRRLKELGLTESLEVGYRLSPRGEAYLSGT